MDIFYDFHIHTNLSPCADPLSTPNNIVNMAKIKGLDAIAITDHNTVGNLLPCMKVGEKVGVTVIPGMEITTSEEIHIVCLFRNIKDAFNFGKYVKDNQPFYKNDEKVFGEQVYYDEFDNEIGKEDRLLTFATNIGVYQLVSDIKKFNGVCFPAHVDRISNGIIGILGEIPKDLNFHAIELNLDRNIEVINNKVNDLTNYKIIYSSDSHYIGNIAERINGKNQLAVEKNTIDCIMNIIHKK